MPDIHNAETVCRTLLEICVAALDDCDRQPVDSYVAAGLVAWDNCCGLLVTAPERVFRTATFPYEGPDQNNCYDGEIAVETVTMLLRCIPVLDDQGQPPAPAVLDAAYSDALKDAAIIWNTLASQTAFRESSLQNQIFVGAEGGCIAVETRLTVGVDGDYWCGPCG
jgi:hypothetical protein